MSVFALLQQPPTDHPATRQRVVLMSGLSDPTTCGLTAPQQRFVDSLPLETSAKLYRNFPYLPGSDTMRLPSLVSASWHNTRQFFQAGGRRYRTAAAPHWRALVDSCERLLVITLSCGLEILNRCASVDPDPPSSSIHVLALGPVARSRPELPHTLVQGERDRVSQLFFRQVDRRLPGGGHMDYLQRPEVLELAAHWLQTHPHSSFEA